MTPSSDAAERFTGRADAYAAARPSYPRELVAHLAERGGWRRDAVIADVGSGTGKFAALLLDAGFQAIAIEPNQSMRDKAEAALGARAGFRSVAGSAESTTLPPASVDAIVAAQAFHWFNVAAAAAEFRRVLKPGGLLALVWNNRCVDGDEFHVAYETLLRTRCPDYTRVAASWADPDSIARAFAPAAAQRASYPYSQRLDHTGFIDRLLSSSYVPKDGEPAAAFRAAADELFGRFAVDGFVAVRYSSDAYYAALV